MYSTMNRTFHISVQINYYQISEGLLYSGPVVIVDKVHGIFQVRADEIKPLFTPKV
jgi:hypothetical protein